MNTDPTKTRGLLACLAGVLLMTVVAGSVHGLEVGVGLSDSQDARAAGADAAAKAKAALGDERPKLVLVFNGMDFEKPEQIGDLLAGVGSVFDPSIVYGCCGYAPLTQHGSEGTVGVLALGGEVQVATAVAPVEGQDGHEACGKRIGQALKPASQAPSAGRLLLLFGDCHVPQNDALVKGVGSVLGEKFPVVGGSSGGTMGVYEKGKLVPNSNLGVLLTGDFTCGFSTKQDNSPQGLIDSARAAFREAIGQDQEKVAVVFVFDCGGRRGMMLDRGNFADELAAMKEVAGSLPIFGFYGSGEIGCPANDAPPCGVGYHIAACAVIGK